MKNEILSGSLIVSGGSVVLSRSLRLRSRKLVYLNSVSSVILSVIISVSIVFYFRCL